MGYTDYRPCPRLHLFSTVPPHALRRRAGTNGLRAPPGPARRTRRAVGAHADSRWRTYSSAVAQLAMLLVYDDAASCVLHVCMARGVMRAVQEQLVMLL